MPPPPPPTAPAEPPARVPLRQAAQGRALLAALPASSRGPERVERVREVYLDTAERDLLAAGYGLCVRTWEGGRCEATLASIGARDAGGRRVRDERTVPLPAPVRDARLLPDGALRRLVAALTGDRPLVPLARVAGTRTRRRLRVDADLAAETRLDRVVVSAGGATAPLVELEVARAKGDDVAFRGWLARAWQDRRVRTDAPSRLERALALARIRVPSPVRIAAARLSLEEVGPGTPSARAGARDFARLAADLERAVASARRGAVEGVHATRTLSRRLQAVLAFHARDVRGAFHDDARARLRALRRAAGPVRDLDVLAEALAAAPLPAAHERGRALLVEVVRARRAVARTALARTLASPRLADLSSRWAGPADELAREPSVPFAWAAALRLPGTLERVFAARRAAGGALAEASGARIHELRIAAKRARYAFDACVPALGKPGRRFAKRLRAFVDEAGELHDAEGHAAAVRDLAHAVPRLAGERTAAERAAALLCEAFDARAARGREALDGLYEAALGSASLRELLGHLAKRVAAPR